MSSRFSHLLAFIFPINTLLFLSSGEHSIFGTLLWTTPFWLLLLADGFSRNLEPQPNAKLPAQFYDGLLYALSLLQFVNIALMLSMVSQLRWETRNDWLVSLVNLIAIRFLVGTSSGTSGIVVAHELIHRPQFALQQLGRLLLCTVCYEHFVITHRRGHHLNMGLPDDIATARLGESFKHYWRRVYLGHLRYAWRSEQERIGIGNGRFPSCKIVQNRVLQGLLVELTLIVFTIVVFGWLAAFMFVYQALAAVRILEAVNYFQHWGLEDARYAHSFGWVNHSQISRYALIGLSHHIGHHENEHHRFHEIAYSDQGPKMPYGYFVMNLWVKLNNASYQKMAIRQLDHFFAEKS